MQGIHHHHGNNRHRGNPGLVVMLIELIGIIMNGKGKNTTRDHQNKTKS
jgi:hypothetical protein